MACGRGRVSAGFAIDGVDRLRDIKADDGRHVVHVVYAVMARSWHGPVMARSSYCMFNLLDVARLTGCGVG